MRISLTKMITVKDLIPYDVMNLPTVEMTKEEFNSQLYANAVNWHMPDGWVAKGYLNPRPLHAMKHFVVWVLIKHKSHRAVESDMGGVGIQYETESFLPLVGGKPVVNLSDGDYDEKLKPEA